MRRCLCLVSIKKTLNRCSWHTIQGIDGNKHTTSPATGPGLPRTWQDPAFPVQAIPCRCLFAMSSFIQTFSCKPCGIISCSATVGTVIATVLPFSTCLSGPYDIHTGNPARLSRPMDRSLRARGLYRRSGISPCPEEMRRKDKGFPRNCKIPSQSTKVGYGSALRAGSLGQKTGKVRS